MQSPRISALLIAILGLAATASAAEPSPPPPRAATQPAAEALLLPKPTGAYSVGRMTIAFQPATPADDVKARAEPRLQPLVQVWYPARPAPAGRPAPTPATTPAPTPAPWMPPDRARLEEKGFVGMLLRKPGNPNNPPADDIPRIFASVIVHAREDVPLADAPAQGPRQFPVILFSAGSQTPPSTYSALLEDLASRGFVVVGYGPTVMGLGIWKQDLSHLLDEMKAWNTAKDHPFFGRLDLDHIGAFGHSFGATAVSTLAATDKRLKAIVLIDGGGDPAEARPIPALILRSEHADLAKKNPAAAQAAARKEMDYLKKSAPGLRVTLQNSVHMSFTDMAVLKPFQLPGDGPALNQTARAILSDFFSHHLQQKPSEFLDKPSPKYPLAKIEKPQ